MVSLYPLSRESVAPLHCAQRLLSYPYVFYFCLLALLLAISQQSLPNNQSAILLQISNVALSLSVNMICCGCSNSASPHDHVCLLCFILSEPSVLCVYSSLSPTPVHQCPCWSTCAQPCFTPMKRWRLRPCLCGWNCSRRLGAQQPSLCPLPSGTECVSCCCRPWPMPAPPNSSTNA